MTKKRQSSTEHTSNNIPPKPVRAHSDVNEDPNHEKEKLSWGGFGLTSTRHQRDRPVLKAFDNKLKEFFGKINDKHSDNILPESEKSSITGKEISLANEKDRLKIYKSRLEKAYNAVIDFVDTDEEFYSKSTLLKTIKEKVYFLSKENPYESYKVTETLIRQAELRYELMHAKRVEKTTLNALSHSESIAKIKTEYQETHNGVEPSLRKIAEILNDLNIESPSGGDSKWHAGSVSRIIGKAQSHQK